MIQVLGNRVLVEQIMIRKKSKIIVPGKDEVNPDQFDIYFKVIDIGDGVPKDTKLQVGSIPIFAKYVDLGTMKILEKSNEKMISNIIVHYDDIAGIDEPDENNQIKSTEVLDKK